MSALKFLKGRATDVANIESFFSAYTRNGTGAEATVTVGFQPDLVWTKSRSAATGHRLADVANGFANELITESTAAIAAAAQGIKSVTASAYVIGTDTDYNNSTGPVTYVDWAFKKQAKFFHTESVVKAAVADKTVDLSTLGVVGMVAVKRTDAAGSWYVWHRSLTAGKLLYLEQTAAEATLGHITVSGTTLTLEDGVIADGTYIVYAWAHDTASTGLIQCGTFTTDAGGAANITLGWEPQFVLTKVSSGGTGNWFQADSARGLTVGSTDDKIVFTNLSDAETDSGKFTVTSTGFGMVAGGGNTFTHIYLAIRRGPMALPTVGTQVYNAIARTGTGAAATVTGVGFPPDYAFTMDRAGQNNQVNDRLRGKGQFLATASTAAEQSDPTGSLTNFNMDGVSFGTYGQVNAAATNYINHFFRRYPGVFDEVCYTGTGSAHTEAHNLTVVPELMIVKKRSAAGDWWTYISSLGNTKAAYLQATTAPGVEDVWNNTTPTATVFTVNGLTNTSTATYVAHLFATLSGISKVGTYTGNGTTQTINCAFAAGARFVLIKRTDSTGNWVVFDSVRGIIAGNDPYLLLNSTAAEDTDEDAVDTDNSGFIVNETTAAVNTNTATYIYLAFA